MTTTTTTPPVVTALELESVHFPPPASSDERASSASAADPNPALAIQPTPERRCCICKQPMKEFVWGGDLIRKTLPTATLPRWLDPLWVDVADPTRIPLCWYGVPFVPKLLYAYAERVGLASYYTREIFGSKPGDLDPFRTWGNLQHWFEKESGLKLDLNLVWGEEGEPDNALTFWSNHQMDDITTEMWDLALDLLDDMEYGDEYELMWYLDRSLRY